MTKVLERFNFTPPFLAGLEWIELSLGLYELLDWSDAPAWANYMAIDEDGEAYWYALRPHYTRNPGVWYTFPVDDEKVKLIGKFEIPLGIDSEDLIFARPEDV